MIKKMSLNQITVSLLFIFFSFTAESELLRTADGWTIFKASQDSLIVYVSSRGDDKTAQVYSIQNVGLDPTAPTLNNIKPFKTFAEAFKRTRKNKPDWILIKKGDSFYESINIRSGRSINEPYVITTYGNTKRNPVFNTGSKAALDICCHSLTYSALQGIDFYAHTRDPINKGYSPTSTKGFNFYVNKGHTISNLLLEGNRFKFYTINVIQGLGTIKDVVFRRNSFLDNYSTNSHSQGIYAANASLTLEENIFDHNGWLVQAGKNKGRKDGAATMFNHNTYFNNSKNIRFINNIFSRSSSMHNKWTADKEEHSSSIIVIDNNLYLDGEIGISAGGNVSAPHRFQNFNISNNVMLNIGRSRPTNRSLSWGIEVADWDNGLIQNNIFMNQDDINIMNVYGISIRGTSKNIIIKGNYLKNLKNATSVIMNNSGIKQNINITNNKFHTDDNKAFYYFTDRNLTGYEFNHNKYHTNDRCLFYLPLSTSNWWAKLTRMLDKCEKNNFSNWVELSKENSSQLLNNTDIRNKTIERYQQTIGKPQTIPDFIQSIRQMSINTWNKNYTVEKINQYFQQQSNSE